MLRKVLFATLLMNLIIQELRFGLIKVISVFAVSRLHQLRIRVESVHSILSFKGNHVLVDKLGEILHLR